MIRLFVLLMAGVFLSFAAQAQERFFQTIPDLPLMPGLVEVEDAGALFDSPQGRIAEGKALLNHIDPPQVWAFYQETLPQLGWRKQAESRYIREDEMLEMGIVPAVAGRGATLSVLLRPLGQGR